MSTCTLYNFIFLLKNAVVWEDSAPSRTGWGSWGRPGTSSWRRMTELFNRPGVKWGRTLRFLKCAGVKWTLHKGFHFIFQSLGSIAFFHREFAGADAEWLEGSEVKLQVRLVSFPTSCFKPCGDTPALSRSPSSLSPHIQMNHHFIERIISLSHTRC